MSTLEQDRRFLDAGVRALEAYLLRDGLYAALPGPSTLPRLTLGGLLLARARLGPQADGSALQLEAVRSRWRSAWEAKARREVRARSDLWKNYLVDYREAPHSHADEYPQQVRYRTMIALLGEEAHSLDPYLRSNFVPGAFVWEAECAAQFEPQAFWFLFGRLKE